jgi:hypothetical protein
MKARTIGLTVLLAAGLAIGPACKRDALSEPGPVGPSTIFQTFTLSVSTDVIMAGTTRTPVQVKAVVKQGNVPVMNDIVFFTINSGPGFFSDFSTRVAVATDENGAASVTFLGPLKSEIASDMTTYIRAQLQTDQIDPLYKDTWIHILLGS